MGRLNVIGIDTDAIAHRYLTSKGIPHITPRLEDQGHFYPISRTTLESEIRALDEHYKSDKFNLVVGGSGLWHHVNLGILDRYHRNQEFDIYNLDNHWDTNPPKDFYQDIVDCSSHLAFALLDRRKVLISSGDHKDFEGNVALEHALRYAPEGMRNYHPDLCIRNGNCDRKNFSSLEEGLKEIREKIYVTIDIDALSAHVYTCDYINQGYMQMEHFLGFLKTAMRMKHVLGANIFGLSKDERSSSVYDQIVSFFQGVIE